MHEPMFGTDDEWRTAVIIELVHLRISIFELAILIALIAVGAFAARWWEGAPIAGAVMALIGAIYFYRHSEKEHTKLSNDFFLAKKDRALGEER